ncbi:MAG: gamma-glutamyl-gamma-aminobutyrate hydrolase family protein [Dehalococcoidia bacterium]|nr:gamma-glutamyl-gamma-aminobutyrate hydrolase family protein [Dehalococcoidia bacterium]
MAKPLILVTAALEHSADPYVVSLERRGALVRVVSPQEILPPGDPMSGATALLLTGGADVDPELYGAAVDPKAGVHTNRPRDDMEMALLRHALRENLPILGVCRGMQLLNVAFGGKLIQDLPNHREQHGAGPGHSAFHEVYVSLGTKLAAILGTGGFFRLNSRHHQGLKEPQKSVALLASAYSLGDGLIEAVESPAHDWVIGVQCHPENEDEMPKAFSRLFQAFVERAETAAGRRRSTQASST